MLCFSLNLQEPISKPPQEICKYPDRKEELKYVDELIQKQASEITELKNELRTLKCQHREEVTEMERQMTLKEREYIHTVSGLEAELRNSEDRYDTQVKGPGQGRVETHTCHRCSLGSIPGHPSKVGGSSGYSDFFHQIRPQNANICAFENAFICSMSFLCNQSKINSAETHR